MYVNLRMGLSSDCDGTVSILLQLWIRILMTHWTVQTAQSERRCFCNDVTCVTTGYMCKSSLGICFTQTTNDGATRVRFYHACAEMLPESHVNACAGGIEVGSRVTAKLEGGPEDRVQVVCCSADMCNYREGQQRPPPAIQQTDEGSHFVHHSPGDQQRASADRHIWFQALVIAVSLIGTVVLLFLLVVTVKILVLNQRRRSPPMSRSSKAEDVTSEGNNPSMYPDERVRCHVIGPEAEMDRSCCCCEEEEDGGTREGQREGRGDRVMGCGRIGGDVGAKVYPVSYQCVAFAAGESAFRTDLVPCHHHHAYLLHHHHHHCRHFTHHHHPHRYPLFNPHEKCRCPSNDTRTNDTLQSKTM